MVWLFGDLNGESTKRERRASGEQSKNMNEEHEVIVTIERYILFQV